jgi:hypothetical protein
MTDLDHLKECYTEYRKELKRGYGVHSFETGVPNKRIAEVSSMVDNMKCFSNDRFSIAIMNELTAIVKIKTTICFKSTLKATLTCVTANEFVELERVIKRECRTV